jgi:hypothetical protein
MSRVEVSKRNYYCWKDKDYRDFIIHLLVHLEPFRENKYVKIIEELDEFTILQFVNKGKIQIGFELNNEVRFALQFNNGIVVGAWGCSNNERSKYVYRTKTNVEGFFVRKYNWLDVLNSNQKIKMKILQNLYIDEYF